MIDSGFPKFKDKQRVVVNDPEGYHHRQHAKIVRVMEFYGNKGYEVMIIKTKKKYWYPESSLCEIPNSVRFIIG